MRRKSMGRALSIVLAVCMLVGTIPGDMLGSMGTVKAAEGEGLESVSPGDAGSGTLPSAAPANEFDPAKLEHVIDVWDFGAEQLVSTETVQYVNKLNEDLINDWFTDAHGTMGHVLTEDLATQNADGKNEFVFNGNGKKNRYRTVNTNLTRYDEKSLKDISDSSIIYKGYIYSNSGSNPNVNMQLSVGAGDIVTFYVSSNGGNSDIVWKSPKGIEQIQTYTGSSSQAQKMTFYAAETGMYTLYSGNEKLVVARIMRETPKSVTVSGTISAPTEAVLTGGKLEFTNTTTGVVTEAEIVNGSYQVTLQEQYSYDIALTGVAGYIVGAQNSITLGVKAGDTSFPVEIVGVAMVQVSGSLGELKGAEAEKLTLVFASENIYVPEYTIDAENGTYTAKLEAGVEYQVTAEGVQDYSLTVGTLKAEDAQDVTKDLLFEKKPVYAVTITLDGVAAEDAEKAEFTFTNVAEEGYVYHFTGLEGIALRDGQYKVEVAAAGYRQLVTADLKVNGAALSKTVPMEADGAEESVAYRDSLNVGAGEEFQTINQALDQVRRMEREDDQEVTIWIQPGNYEEMLVIDEPHVTLKNASTNPSLELINQGVDIADNAVRVTSYYGHGYTYYSMGEDCKYDEQLLAANVENGYPSFENPGSGTTAGSYWNATVVVEAGDFHAEGIIFENSFNQYVSEKAAADVIVAQTGAKEGSVARASMEAGSVAVQQKAYVERAAALAMHKNLSNITFDNCKFVGRQDTLYGGTDTYAEFHNCSVYGGTDYIFGGMIAIFDQCDLVFNTSDDKNDVGYITAAQQPVGRGYLMYQCNITSTVPGVDTASAYPSKPGYLGRPWAANTSEVVFYQTTIDAAGDVWVNADSSTSKTNGASLIVSEGWLNSLSGESAGMCEYGTIEKAENYSPSRAAWATVLTEAKLADGTAITMDAFRQAAPVSDYFEVDLSAGLKAGQVYDGGISVVEDMAYKTVNGDVIAGTTYTGYVAGSSNPKTDGSNSTGTVPNTGSALKLTAEKDGKLKIAVKINSGKTVYLVEESGSLSAESYQNAGSSSEFALLSYDVEAGRTYYFYGNGTKVPIYAVTVDYRQPVAWSAISAPVLGTPSVDGTDGTITVPFTAQVGGLYADSLEVRMLLDGEVVDTISYATESMEGSVTFAPNASGAYSFQAILRRSGALGKESNQTEGTSFVLPMRQPVIINVENQGAGNVKFSWKAVSEAESYHVYLNGELAETVTTPFSRFTGLEIGTEYEFGVEAVHGEDVSKRAVINQTIQQEAEKSWSYAAFGTGVDTKNNGYSGSIEGQDLSLWSRSGKGKLVPASTDGLAFYYTTMDPTTENFTLSADVIVDEWTYSNGQEGFGLMAADTVGEDGDSSTIWNNSYMASVTKVEYYWDSQAGKLSDAGDKYTMKLGVGSQEKIGVTPENVANETTVNEFSTQMTSLETYCAENQMGAGTYNRVANYTNDKSVDLGDANTQKTFHLTIERNNTGYFLSYTDENGVTTTNKYYHGEEDALTKLDANNIYLGFFASRYAKIRVENVSLTTVDPAKDAPAEERPTTYVTPNYSIESAKTANSADYKLVYYGNADGILSIKDAAGNAVVSGEVIQAGSKFAVNTTLQEGVNQFNVEFTPNADYKPSAYELLSSYETKKFTFTVVYQKAQRNVLYISPEGSSDGTGSKSKPLDIYTAVKYAAPGQQLILMEGTYLLNSTVTIDRGIDGTSEQLITMMADPEAATRPVLDFQRKCAGMVLAGDYWYFQGFAVTNSSNGQKGIQVSGSNNVLDNIHAYRNGNTGIQISRYKGTDNWEDWPADNLILNCTSYLNADAGYEDADGFAAKLTIADGNVFDGCIAAYNADDGWDLFAKVESGPIGKVIIRNSLAFKNGYVVDAAGQEVTAGNGNGFKMGGSSISGYHTLENSVAFANKSKGIDSNSCPDIQVYNSTSYNNESYNVAFYTNDAKKTDFLAQGVLSFKDANSVGEQFKLKVQDESKVYGENNYYFDGKASVNTEGVKAAAEWFKNLDTDTAIHGGIQRNADGTINMNGYLELTASAPAQAGARMAGTASAEITIKTDPEEPDGEEPGDSKPQVTPEPTPVPTPEATPAPTPDQDQDQASPTPSETPGNTTTAAPGLVANASRPSGSTAGQAGNTPSESAAPQDNTQGETNGTNREEASVEPSQQPEADSNPTTIPEETVPTAAQPQDTDSNSLWLLLGLAAVIVVAAGIMVIMYRRKEEE